jgi:hypothetical protein
VGGGEFYELISCVGLSVSYLSLTEANITSSAGAAYVPPERGDWRRIAGTRQIQLLQDCPGVVETFQTSAAEVRLPCNSIGANNDAGDGRIFWFKNSGTGAITIKDYAGIGLWVAQQFAIVLIVGNDNNNWDFYFVAKNIFYDNTTSGIAANEVQTAIDLLAGGAGSGASPGFTYGRSGNVGSNTYLLNDTVPSNVSGRTVPVTGFVSEVFVAQELADTFSFKIQKRSGASFVDLATITVTSVRTTTASLSNVAVVKGDELSIVVSSGSCKNPVIGFVVKGTTA